MHKQFETLYQENAEQLESKISLEKRMSIWKDAQNKVNHSDRFVKDAITQYFNDRALDGLSPEDAWSHTMGVCWRAAEVLNGG